MSAGRQPAGQGENKFIITRLPHLGNVLRFIVIVTRFYLSLSLFLSLFFSLSVYRFACVFYAKRQIVNADARIVLIRIRISRFILFTCCSAAIKDAAVFIFSPQFLYILFSGNLSQCPAFPSLPVGSEEVPCLQFCRFKMRCFSFSFLFASVCTMKPMKSAMRFQFSVYLLFILFTFYYSIPTVRA